MTDPTERESEERVEEIRRKLWSYGFKTDAELYTAIGDLLAKLYEAREQKEQMEGTIKVLALDRANYFDENEILKDQLEAAKGRIAELEEKGKNLIEGIRCGLVLDDLIRDLSTSDQPAETEVGE
ncbi:MAG: hypothetical protein ACR2QC_04055 [Gammaproteobacteria bacterium]